MSIIEQLGARYCIETCMCIQLDRSRNSEAQESRLSFVKYLGGAFVSSFSSVSPQSKPRYFKVGYHTPPTYSSSGVYANRSGGDIPISRPTPNSPTSPLLPTIVYGTSETSSLLPSLILARKCLVLRIRAYRMPEALLEVGIFELLPGTNLVNFGVVPEACLKSANVPPWLQHAPRR